MTSMNFTSKKKLDSFETYHHLRESYPEISKYTLEDFYDQFPCDIVVYKLKTKRTPVLIRFTMPLAVIVIALLIVGIPFGFLITGKWGYSGKMVDWIDNWFRSIGWA